MDNDFTSYSNIGNIANSYEESKEIEYTISVSDFAKNLNLNPIYKSSDYEDVQIVTAEINRAGFVLAGFLEHNNPDRLQICGKVEMAYLSYKSYEERLEAFNHLFEMKPPAIVITRSNKPFPEMVEFAKKYDVTLFSSPLSTSHFMSDAISLLNVELAQRITRHGVLVEVYGEGILLLGDSGIGKSETAIELVKRGHRLIADDAVELRKVSGRTIVGSSPMNIRHYIELRGIGIVNVRRIFGMGSVKVSEKIDLVINLEIWEKDKNYSTIGLGDPTIDILGVPLPVTTIPVKPGRNLAIIIEVAAMNNRDKKMGYNSAEELMQRLGLNMEEDGSDEF
ncbi:MAG: HPr(Ser) kinase/phosphatase [Ruminococcaceae bacterium]|nr:HPr(Ser) kinase/phosphatase [Oscillospiraceae bacterium]